MSLNYREIDCVLRELRLNDSYIREVSQPDYAELQLLLNVRRQNMTLRIAHATRRCAVHRSGAPFRSFRHPTRFVEFLRARVRHGRIVSVYQLSAERIIRMAVAKDGVLTLLWVRLWSGAANTVATDSDMVILDALYRRPQRNEASGARFVPIESDCVLGDTERYLIRDYDTTQGGSFNEWVDTHYRVADEARAREELVGRVRAEIIGERERAEYRLRSVRVHNEESAAHYRRCGELLLAHIASVPTEAGWVTLYDDITEREFIIRLDPTLNAQQNARRYFDRYKNGTAQREHHVAQKRALQSRLKKLTAELNALASYSDVQVRELAGRYSRRQRETSLREGRSAAYTFESAGHTIFVGRSARDNEWVMRTIARPHDVWLHARGVPGSTVIVRVSATKSLPSQALVDGAMLASFYSNQRSSGGGDVHYTRVKFVRRPKGGVRGVFIPFREKNIAIEIQNERIAALHSRGGSSVVR